jgi:hypothetical protein
VPDSAICLPETAQTLPVAALDRLSTGTRVHFRSAGDVSSPKADIATIRILRLRPSEGNPDCDGLPPFRTMRCARGAARQEPWISLSGGPSLASLSSGR